jgi:hypothetical protein
VNDGPCEPLTITYGDGGRVHINGVFVGEFLMGRFEGRDALEAEVNQARRLRTLLRVLCGLPDHLRRIVNIEDHVNTNAEKKRSAFLRGLAAGLLGETVDHPSPDVPPIAPEQSRAYLHGYEDGDAIRRVLRGLTPEGEP